jgi:uncharacterized protein with HEPN domain
MTERTILHYYLEDILKALESIQDYVENMEFDSFKIDKKQYVQLKGNSR